MRFISVFTHEASNRLPTEAEMASMGKLIEEGMKAGWLVATEGCLPSALGARVRIAQGNFTVVDGPFTETKELVGGFAILRADSKEEAIKLTKHFLNTVGTGECELRQLFDGSQETCLDTQTKAAAHS